MLRHVLRDKGIRPQRRSEHEAHLALLHHVGSAVAASGLRPSIRDQFHAECGAIEVRSLTRVANVELHVVSAAQRQEVFVRCGSGRCRGRKGGTHTGFSVVRSAGSVVPERNR